jgi:hypothetical protein
VERPFKEKAEAEEWRTEAEQRQIAEAEELAQAEQAKAEQRQIAEAEQLAEALERQTAGAERQRAYAERIAAEQPTLADQRSKLLALVRARADAEAKPPHKRLAHRFAIAVCTRRAYPDGKLPHNTAKITREIARHWPTVAPKYDLDPKRLPDPKTVASALGLRA